MSRRLEMIFDPKVNNVSGVEQLAAAIAEVQSRTQLAGSNLETFRGLIERSIQAGRDLRVVLNDVAKGAVSVGSGQVQSAARQMVDAWNAETKAAQDAAKAATQAAEEIAQAKRKETEAAKKAEQELRQYAASIRQSIQNPLGALGNMAEQFALQFGKSGVYAAGFGLALGVVGKKAFDMVKDFGEASRETVNLAARLGLSASQARLLQVEAGLAGINIRSLEYSSHILANALEDSTGSGKRAADALKRMGIDVYGAGLQARDVGVVLNEVINKLATIKDPTERAREAFILLGRGSKEILPMVAELDNLRATAQRLGLDFDDNFIKKGAETQHAFKEMELAFDAMKQKLASKIAPIIVPIVLSITQAFAGKDEKEKHYLFTLGGGGRRGLHPTEETDENPAAKLAESYLGKERDQMRAMADKIIGTDRDAGKKLAEAFKKRYAATEEGLKAELRELEKNQEKLTGELSSGNAGNSAIQKSGEREFQKNQIQIESIKAKLKAMKDLGSTLNKVEEIEKRAAESGLTGAAKLVVEEQEVIKHLHLRGQLLERVKIAYQKLIEVEQEKEAKAFSDTLAKFQDKIIRGQFDRAQKGALSLLQIEHPEDTKGDAEAAYKVKVDLARQEFFFEAQRVAGLKTADEQHKAILNAFAKLQENTGNAELALRQKLAELAKKDGEERVKTQQKILDIQLASEKSEIQRRAARTIRLATLNAGPGDEVHAVVQGLEAQKQLAIELFQFEVARAAKEKDANEQRVAYVKALEQLKQDFANAELERETKIAEIRKKALDDYRTAAGKIFDALTSRGSGGLQAFFLGELKTIEKQIFVNASSLLYSTFQKNQNKFQIPGQVNSDGTLSTVGKLLQGTPFGISPEQQFQSQTAKNTQDTVTALGAIYAALTGTDPASLGLPGVGNVPIPGFPAGLPFGGSLPGFPAGLPGLGSLGTLLQKLGMNVPGLTTNAGGFETGGGGTSVNIPFFGSDTSVGGGSASANRVLLSYPFASNQAGPFSFENGHTSLAAGLFNVNKDKADGGGAGNAAISGIASATALYTGITSALHSFRQGGAQGALGGISAIAGTAALFDPEPISKAVLMGIGAFTGIISSLFGDPRANRDASIRHELTNNRYYAPLPKRMTIDESGNLVDFSSTNAVRSYQGSWATAPDGGNPGPGIPIIVNVHAIDNKSIIDHGPAIAEAVRVAVNRGAARPMVNDLRQQMMPR